MVSGLKPKKAQHLASRFLANFNKKHLWWIVPLTGVFLVVAVQIFWPATTARFGVSLAGDDFSLLNDDIVVERVQKRFSEARIILDFKGKKQEVELSRIGASLDSQYMKEQFFRYNFSERLIPFSIFFGRKIKSLALDFDQSTLDKFIDQYGRDHETDFKNASVELTNEGEIVLSQAVAGSKIAKHRAKISILGHEYVPGIKPEINMPFDEKTPSKKADFYEPAIREIKNIKNYRINFLYNKLNERGGIVEQKIYTPSTAEFISWIVIDERSEFARLDVGDKLKVYADKLNKDLEKPATSTKVKIIDGREVEKIEGESGYRVSLEAIKKFVQRVLAGEVSDLIFPIEFEEVKPTVAREESYTNSQAGLEAKLQQIGRRYDVRISLKQLNGAGWEAHYRADESTPSASTYKLYVALKMFDEMKRGLRSWDDNILGKNHRQCFEQMIVVSLNECAEEWIRQFGRANLNQYIYDLGISRTTTFQSYDATRTTSRDLMKAVIGIYHDQFVSGENRNALIGAMGRQKWRYGIPTGSKGRVYDKVGFLWNYIHDTAIVEHPRGTYAVAIMTKNASYGVIAQITRELEAFMYP